MSPRFRMIGLSLALISLLLLSAPAASAEYFEIESIPNQTLTLHKTLSTSAYTSGVEKSFLATWSI
jgi:hypothetical protein